MGQLFTTLLEVCNSIYDKLISTLTCKACKGWHPAYLLIYTSFQYLCFFKFQLIYKFEIKYIMTRFKPSIEGELKASKHHLASGLPRPSIEPITFPYRADTLHVMPRTRINHLLWLTTCGCCYPWKLCKLVIAELFMDMIVIFFSIFHHCTYYKDY